MVSEVQVETIVRDVGAGSPRPYIVGKDDPHNLSLRGSVRRRRKLMVKEIDSSFQGSQ